MQERKKNNQELDAIGKHLFAASRLTEAEIDRIASGPDMFDGVRRRISQQEAANVSGLRFSISRLAFGSTLTGLLILGVFAFYLQQNQFGHVKDSDSVLGPDQARAESTPQVGIVKGFTQARATFLDEKVIAPAPPQYDIAIQRETRRPQPRVERASYTQPRENDFVAVTYVGEGAESTRGGRVVRVDVPRSTLFAMGFHVSLENESPTVKADLLIGPDGVTRAVRLVE